MPFVLRPYQEDAKKAIFDYFATRKGKAPVAVLPTGAGKTPLLSEICRKVVETGPKYRVIVLSHVAELVLQSYEKLKKSCPNVEVGIYSASLNSREADAQIVCAQIQSCYSKAFQLGKFALAIVDECHLIPNEGMGRYRTFFNDSLEVNVKMKKLGLTATPFRLDSGTIVGEGKMFDDVCYEIGVRDLIEQGFLCNLITKKGKESSDVSGLHIRMGEYNSSEMEALFNGNVAAACAEAIEKCSNRKSVLVFTSGVEHANNVADFIRKKTNSEVGVVVGSTPKGEREKIIEDFKRGRIKWLVNCNVLTTGFDAPNVDAVVIMRATTSPGLFYQICGRGLRLSESKNDCLIVDYGSNVERLGPIDDLNIKEKGKEKAGVAPTKVCPKCDSICYAGVAKCDVCGHEFPPPESNEKIEEFSSERSVLSREFEDVEYDVKDAEYYVHVKEGKELRTMRVEYLIGYKRYIKEWICPEHVGALRQKAKDWWFKRSSATLPETAEECVELARNGYVVSPKKIVVRYKKGDEYGVPVKYLLPNKSTLEEKARIFVKKCGSCAYFFDGSCFKDSESETSDGSCVPTSELKDACEHWISIDETIPF